MVYALFLVREIYHQIILQWIGPEHNTFVYENICEEHVYINTKVSLQESAKFTLYKYRYNRNLFQVSSVLRNIKLTWFTPDLNDSCISERIYFSVSKLKMSKHVIVTNLTNSYGN